MSQRVYNFSPGPAALPEPVLAEVQRDLLALPGVGASVMEISHRSAAFANIIRQAEANLRTLLSIPDNYAVLFLQGGARLQFSMVPLNLFSESQSTADYVVTGSWSKYALKEAGKEGQAKVAWDGAATNYDQLPANGDLILHPDAAYVYYTSNETIQGVQFGGGAESTTPSPRPPVPPPDVPLVCDASSDFLSRPVDVRKYGVYFGCAQKNAGPAGVTVVIIRKDLLERSGDSLPGYLNYKLHAEAGSLWNTPPTFAVYVVMLVTKWLLTDIGGLERMHAQNQAKAKMLYDVIDESDGFYTGHTQPDCRSLMNVTFRLPNDELSAKFASGALERGLTELKGHRSVGGIRASIYNAMPVAGVELLREYMIEFWKRSVVRC